MFGWKLCNTHRGRAQPIVDTSFTSHAVLTVLVRKLSRYGDMCSEHCRSSGWLVLIPRTNASTYLNPVYCHYVEMSSYPSSSTVCCSRHTQCCKLTGGRQRSDPQRMPLMSPDFEADIVEGEKKLNVHSTSCFVEYSVPPSHVCDFFMFTLRCGCGLQGALLCRKWG